jgi:hypothetical protein
MLHLQDSLPFSPKHAPVSHFCFWHMETQLFSSQDSRAAPSQKPATMSIVAKIVVAS